RTKSGLSSGCLPRPWEPKNRRGVGRETRGRRCQSMISPFVRRHRLAAELVRLREENRYSAQKLASEIGVGRQSISRLENGHISPDLSVIMKILGLFSVGQRRWE